jgi:hypothetical protein
VEYQEPTWGIGFLPWSGWHGCYVIFHVKLLGRVEALVFLAVFEPRFSFVMICYHHVWGDLVFSQFCVSNPREAVVELYGHLRYIHVRGLVRSISSTDHG